MPAQTPRHFQKYRPRNIRSLLRRFPSAHFQSGVILTIGRNWGNYCRRNSQFPAIGKIRREDFLIPNRRPFVIIPNEI